MTDSQSNDRLQEADRVVLCQARLGGSNGNTYITTQTKNSFEPVA
jgi:hypothetical protein